MCAVGIHHRRTLPKEQPPLAGGAMKLGVEASSLDAEMVGLELAIGALLRISRGYVDVESHQVDAMLPKSTFLEKFGHLLALPHSL